ncbi:MAG: hypothetical protein OHK0012_12330 [Synechococcales cyanobacterium]
MNRSAAQQLAQELLANPDALILDTETTDFNGYIVEMAVIDMQGRTLFNQRFNPLANISPSAQRVHGISLEDLVEELSFSDRAEALAGLLRNKLICAYNASFDQKIVENECRRLNQDWGLTWQCLMKPYAAWVGEWNWQRQDYRWQKLPSGDHSALGDCLAALTVVRRMAGLA